MVLPVFRAPAGRLRKGDEMAFRKLDDLGDVAGKVALVRVDFNLPMKDGAVTEDTRVRAAAPTILELADKGAKVLLLAHFGRPKGSAALISR
jgi:phosphoglycerate kinase